MRKQFQPLEKRHWDNWQQDTESVSSGLSHEPNCPYGYNYSSALLRWNSSYAVICKGRCGLDRLGRFILI